MIYTVFKYLHSGLRYVVLILVLLAILQALSGWLGKKPYTEANRKINLFALISAHIQLVFGLILYFVSPIVQFTAETMKNATARYWTVEHIIMMVFAIIIITVGHSRSKKAPLPELKHRSIAIFYILALIIIAVAILQSGRPFFGISA